MTSIPNGDVRPTGQTQGQGQVQQQQQQVVVNVNTGDIHTQAKKAKSGSAPRPTQTTTTNVGSGNDSYGGGSNVTNTGNGVAIGNIGDNATFNIGDGNTINNNTQPPADPPEPPNPPYPPNPPEPEKPSISRGDRQAGKALAMRLHAETNSSWANNGNIASVMGTVNSNNAYSFFTEYNNLARNDLNPATTGAMHDSFDVSDMFNSINIKNTMPAVQALLSQAEGLPGVAESDEYATLSTLVNLANNQTNGIIAELKTPDLDNNEAKSMDTAIRALLDRMSREYQ